jgi:hypothetical protein
MLHLFNHIFPTEQFPESFGGGIKIPIYKRGDIENPHNYRGITLIN